MKETNYISQENGYSCCHLIALLNAHRFWGLETISPEDPEWEEWVDIWLCRNGSVIGVERMYADLQICWRPIALSEKCIRDQLPIEVSHFDPHAGFHSSLVVDLDGEKWTIINRSGPKQPLVQVVNQNELRIYKHEVIQPPGLVSLIYQGRKADEK